MIFAVVVFVLNGQAVGTLQSTQPFQSMAQCEAFIAREQIGLDFVAEQMTAQGHGEVTALTRCIDTRASA